MTCNTLKTKLKIIYLCYMPLTEKREKDFFIKEAGDSDLSVEYWDLTKIYFPEMTFVGEIKRLYVKKINNYGELEEAILAQDIKRCLFVIIITFYGQVIKLYRLLTQYHCCLVFFARAGLPVDHPKKPLLRKLLENHAQYLAIDRIKLLYLNQLAKLYKHIGLIKDYDLVFAAGTVETSQYNGRSSVVAINHFDYDNYLGVKNKVERIIKEDFCVFLDENLVYHTDFKITHTKTIEPIPYFKSLCSFFDRLEKRYHLKVVIAAHPKAEYKGHEFGDRAIIKGKTLELVKDCRFALAHNSTSISFAILNEKPLCFIYTNEIKKINNFEVIKHYASVLDATIFNIDTIYGNNELQISSPNHLRYEEYKYKYLTSKTTEEKLSIDIFIQHMTELAASI